MESSKFISKDQFQAGNTKRRLILSLCHQMPIERGFTKFNPATCRREVDFNRLNEFLTGSYSIYKKKLNYHTPEELSKVIIQFENILKGYLK